MRTITEIKTVYKFDELSDRAKEKARDWMRESNYELGYPWADETRQSLEAFAKLFPITLKDWSYGGRGEGVYFSIDDENIEGLKGLRLHRWLMNNIHPRIFKGKYYSTVGKHVDGKYTYTNRHSNCQLESSCPLTGYCMDEVLLDPVHAFLKKPALDVTLKDLLEDCFHAWVKEASNDADYQNSDEAIDESIHANDYEFDENGKVA